MNIKREFLYTEDKFVPIQLLKTNYALAQPSTSTNFIDNVIGVRSRELEIKFGLLTSNMVMSLDSSTDPPTIKEVRSSPPGSSYVKMNIEDGREYNLYVISRESEDGFIKGDFTVGDASQSADNLSVTYESAHDFIDLSREGAMTESRGRDDTDIEQWYGYDGFYEGDLVWFVPLISPDGTGGEHTYLIYYRDILNDMIQIFESNDVGNGINSDKIEDGIKTWKSHDELVRYVNKLDANPFLRNIDVISDLIGYLREENNLKEEYVTLSYDAHELVDGMLSTMYYGNAKSLEFTNGALFNWVPDPDNPVYRDEGTWYPPWDNYYSGLKVAGSSTEFLTKYTNITALASKISGIGRGGSAHKSWWSQGGSDAWSRGRTEADVDGPTARRDFASYVANMIKTYKNSINSDLENLGIPLGVSGEVPDELENYIMNRSEYLQENILDHLKNELVIADAEIIRVGDELFNHGGSGDTGDIRYLPLDTTVMPEWFDINVDFLTQQFSVATELEWILFESDTYGPEFIWNGLIRLGYLQEERASWASPNDLDLDGIDEWSDGDVYNPDFPGTDYRRHSDWIPVVNYINENLDLLYPIDPCPECPLSGGTDDSNSGEDYFPQTQEAILQNIRFLKDLINSVDENLWTSYNTTSALMLSSLISLRDNVEATPVTTTIMNITNSTVRDDNVEILWQKISDGGGPWQTLSESITDIGEDMKLINLSGPEFSEVGKYVIQVRPKRIIGNVDEIFKSYCVVKDDFNEYPIRNYFYGHNAQFYTQQGDIQGDQKIIVEYEWSGLTSYLKFSPLIENLDEIDRDIKIEIWSNEFIPTTIEVEIVEHNALTLSYSMYAKKELNTDTGLCVIYDYAGNPYKKLSFGKYSNAGTGNAIIEYRTPEDDTDGY